MAPQWTPIGQMRHLITIQVATQTRTANNEVTETWSNVCSGYAKIEPVDTPERWVNKTQQDLTTQKINMLYQPGIIAKMRATFGTRVFNFTTVTNVLEMNRELRIIAQEATAT